MHTHRLKGSEGASIQPDKSLLHVINSIIHMLAYNHTLSSTINQVLLLVRVSIIASNIEGATVSAIGVCKKYCCYPNCMKISVLLIDIVQNLP